MIRIGTGNMPPLFRSIVSSTLETQEDITVVPAESVDFSNAAANFDVILVAAGHDGGDNVALASLAGGLVPPIVEIDADGHSAVIVSISRERRAIESGSDMCETVRDAARQARARAN